MRSKSTIAGLFVAMSLLLSGCFFVEHTLVINSDGKADVEVGFWFDKIQAGDQGSIGVQELLYLFPELQDYKVTKTETNIEYSTYLTYSFQMSDVDINKNQYIDFRKQDDGSYFLKIVIPKAIEEKKESNNKVLIVKVTMPAEIDMANTMNYENNTAEWELRQNDFTRDVILKVFTKPLVEKKTEQKKDDTIDFSTPQNTVRTYYQAVFVAQDKSLAQMCYSEKTSSLLVQTLRSPLEIKNQLVSQGINFNDYVRKILTADFGVDQEQSKKYPDPENERLVKVKFDEKSHNWKVAKEKGEWRIAMLVGESKEQGEVWLRITPEIQPFFDLFTPENALRSFIEAVMLEDKEQAQKCWSDKNLWSESFIDGWVKGVKKGHPEISKFLVRATQYGKKVIDKDNYYVFTIPPGSRGESKIIQCKVTWEGGNWKILMFKDMEDDPLIRVLLATQGISWSQSGEEQ